MIADRTTLSIAKAGELVGVSRRTILDPGPTPLPPESKGNGLRLAGEPSLG